MSFANISAVHHLKRCIYKALDLKRLLFTYHHSVILCADSPSKAEPNVYALVAHDRNTEHIYEVYSAWGRNREFGDTNLKRIIANRFRHGMRFFEVRHERVCIASAWVHDHGFRFIDELAYRVSVPDKAIWIRDVYVHTPYRGNRINTTMIGMIVRDHYPDLARIYSDTVKNNISSLRAHKNAGFRVVGHVRIIKLMNRLFIRGTLPQELVAKDDGDHGGAGNILYCDVRCHQHIRENVI